MKYYFSRIYKRKTGIEVTAEDESDITIVIGTVPG